MQEKRLFQPKSMNFWKGLVCTWIEGHAQVLVCASRGTEVAVERKLRCDRPRTPFVLEVFPNKDCSGLLRIRAVQSSCPD